METKQVYIGQRSMTNKNGLRKMLEEAAIDPTQTLTARRILAEFIERVDESGLVSIALRKLGKEMGIRFHSQVMGAIQCLEEGRYLSVEQRGKGRRPNVYRLRSDRPSKPTHGE